MEEAPGRREAPQRPVELRVSGRCLVEDIGADQTADVPHQDLIPRLAERHGLVRAFMAQRRQSPVGTDRMQGLASGRAAVYILRFGARERGLTWFDEEAGVVWLIAAHFKHRSGEASDSYVYFRTLPGDQLRPTQEDFRRLRADQADRQADAVFDGLPELMARAAQQRDTEVRGQVGPIPVRLLMERGMPPPHVHLAIGMWRLESLLEPPPEFVLAIVSAVFRHQYTNWADLPYAAAFPGEPWENELAFEDFVSDWNEP